MKFALRHNLIYPLQLLIWNFVRDTESTLIYKLLKFEGDLIFTPLMFLGELLAGLIIYSYQEKYLNKSKSKAESLINLKTIKLINRKHQLSALDHYTKIFFLIFTSSLYDFVQFVLSFFTPKFINISGSIKSRLSGFLTIFDALFYYYFLRFPIFRHQKFSLYVIGICLFIVIFTEFYFQKFNIFLTVGDFCLALGLIFMEQFSSSMVDSIEKYQFEYNHINPLKALMYEGIFGFIYTFIFNIFYEPFGEISTYKEKNNSTNFALLIFCFVLYLIFSGLKNSFRVITTKIYSPMTTTFLDYILNPFYIIYDFLMEEDFIKDDKRNILYFLINLILSLIISFFGFVYNEFIVLYCYILEIDTPEQVSRRASSYFEEELKIFDDSEEDSVDNYNYKSIII